MSVRRCSCAVLLLSTALGCGSSQSDSSCADQKQEALYNASTTESYLGLAEQEQRALVAIVDQTDEGSICSGAFIAGAWVLTAGHCDELVEGVAVIPAGARMPSARVPVVQRQFYANADIALFQVDFSAASFGTEHEAPEARSLDAFGFDIAPFALPSRELAQLAVDVPVELAGYGLTEQGEAGALHFLVEQVVEKNDFELTVAGFGRSGACDGDSGAPLLMREGGVPVVAGVLWGGSRTCLHEDQYLRTDLSDFGSWVQSVVGTAPSAPAARSCGGISAEGRCLYGSALWCDADVLVSDPCEDDRVCGWSPADSGYRCVAPSAPCAGVDDIGECRDGQVVRCVLGRTQTTSCEACGACRVLAQTGAPYCTAQSDP